MLFRNVVRLFLKLHNFESARRETVAFGKALRLNMDLSFQALLKLIDVIDELVIIVFLVIQQHSHKDRK